MGQALDPLHLFDQGGALQQQNLQRKSDLDTQGVINQQQGSNLRDWQRATQANRPDVQGPYGGQQWTQDPATGEWKLSSSFSGPLAGGSQSLQQQYADLLNQRMRDIGTGEQARDQAIDAAYGQATSRLDPQWDKREAALQTQLLNQGLDPSSEAGRNAMSELGQQRNDAYTSAMNSAILQGNQAGNDVYRNNLLGRESDLGMRNSFLQQLGGMQGLLQAPNYNATGGIQGTDVIGANRNTDAYNIAAQGDMREQQKYLTDSTKDILKWGTDKFLGGVGAGLGGKG